MQQQERVRTTNQVLVMIVLATENPQFNRHGVGQTLSTLERRGWATAIREHFASDGRQRAFYRLTAKGEKALQTFANGARYLSDVAVAPRSKRRA